MAGGADVAGRSVTSRALEVLGAFDTDHRRLTLSEVAARAGIPLTTTHRLVKELVTWGALARRDDGTYVRGVSTVGPRPARPGARRAAAGRLAVPPGRLRRDPGHRPPRGPGRRPDALRRPALRADLGAGRQHRWLEVAPAHDRGRQGAPRICAGGRRQGCHGQPHPADPALDHPARAARARAERGQASGLRPHGRGDVARDGVGRGADPRSGRPGRGSRRHRRPQLAARHHPARPRPARGGQRDRAPPSS